MQSIDMDILKYMSNRDRYFELKDVITKGLCVKESWELLTDFGEYFKAHPNITEIDNDFVFWQRVQRHPNWKSDEARIKGQIVENIINAEDPARQGFLDSIEHIKTTQAYKKISKGLEDGTMTKQEAEEEARQASRIIMPEAEVVTYTLSDLSTNQRSSGLYFRCEDLNRAIGPLRKGDFVIVAKRPEVGGTSFLVSEMSFMLEQVKGNAVIFNNEEAPDKVYSRMISSALGVGYRDLMSDPARYDADYTKWLDGKRYDLVHQTNMTIPSIHKQLETRPYDIIGINVLLKVGGTGKKEDHDKFQELGEECRRIAQEYAPVIAIVQADPSAEGMPFIPQDRIYKSKTALQGEADALIMIGTDEDILPDVRYIHVAKNKMPPAHCTDSKYKHIKSQVKFDMDTGRFTSSNFAGNSRTRSKP